MIEPLPTRYEVARLAADETGTYLLPDVPPAGTPAEDWPAADFLRPELPVMRGDGGVFAAVELALTISGYPKESVALLHGTSCRDDPWADCRIETYAAVIRCDGLVYDRWPSAAPIGLDLLEAAGRPAGHDPAGRPTVRLIDPLLHILRHLLFLMTYDGGAAAALPEQMKRHLASSGLAPALATLYHGNDGWGGQRAA